MRKVLSLIPGTLLALAIAFAAKWLEGLEKAAGLHIIGASVIALFIGMAVNAVWKPNSTTAPGIKFTSKKLLKFAIILLGASLNIRTVLTVGKFSLTVMVFTLATCFGLGALIGKALGLSWKSGIAAEVIGMPDGSIGEQLQHAKLYLDTPDLFCWTLVIVLVSLAFEKIFLALLGWTQRALERM